MSKDWAKINSIRKAKARVNPSKGRSTLKSPVWEPKVPLATDMFVPNHSGISSHVEAQKILAFGEIYANAETTIHSIPGSTWHQIDVFTDNGLSNHNVPDKDENHIVVKRTGIYLITCSIAFSGTGSVDWQFALYTNDGATQFPNVHTNRKLGASGDIGSCSMCGIVSLNKDDTAEIWARHLEIPNKDLTVQDINFSMVQVGV